MTGERSQEHMAGRNRKRKVPVLLGIALVSAGLVVLLQQLSDTSPESPLSADKSELASAEHTSLQPVAATDDAGSHRSTVVEQIPQHTEEGPSLPAETLSGPTGPGQTREPAIAAGSAESEADSSPAFTPPLTTPAIAADAVWTFFTHVDSQNYLRQYQIDAPARIHFARVIQKLLDRPPVVSGESRDLYTLLQNAAHFFRIIGKDNTLALKTVMTREAQYLEELMAHLYLLASSPELVQNRFGIVLNQDALYDYAGYFLSTMGGRLYLFRRAPSLRLLVSYYCVLLLHAAEQQGNNRHGIDVRQSIEAVLSDMENGGGSLRGQQQYLATLRELQEKYRQ